MPIPLKERCGVCNARITCWAYKPDEEPKDSDLRCDGIVCDFADSRGCFNHYCKDCFDKHSCGACDKGRKVK